eukprot:TRINITY_DN2850_c0_g1_i6.p2 TRINITY_DN2850_c0_g1~~TRINITY_DN2850_c0_g1_i6.p2  ORF type:complete len:494 (-),score=107.92 TRINITY_DN2850_c0_g1_i6:129-1610(-)
MMALVPSGLPEPPSILETLGIRNISSTEEKWEGRPRVRRRRWDITSATPATYPMKNLPPEINLDEANMLSLRMRIEELNRRLSAAKLEMYDGEDRSPSPPPKYNPLTGKRTNTRDQRAREKLEWERQKLITEATNRNPHFKPPLDYKAPPRVRSAKLYIPQSQFPEYNFIGLIIGPRGNTQKRLEKETGAKISVRGRGSHKEGKRSKTGEGDDEELHVFLQADTQEALDKGVAVIKEILVPVDETTNEHKRMQLRELAEINGTLRDPSLLADPNAPPQTWKPADVQCSICHEVSHITRDCPLRGKGVVPSADSKTDADYMNFLEELGAASGSSHQVSNKQQQNKQDADKQYEDFLAAIGEAPSAGSSSAPAPAPTPAPAPGPPPHMMGGAPFRPPFPGGPYGAPSPYGHPGYGGPSMYGPPGFSPYGPPPGYSPYGPPGAPSPYGYGMPQGPPGMQPLGPPGAQPQTQTQPQQPSRNTSSQQSYNAMPPPPGL